VTLGVILGVSIGIADVLLMLLLSFPDKRTALLAAFSSRFSLGFFAARSTCAGLRSPLGFSWDC
jgi:hypothetical protein